jgi:hypothetical protein
MNELDCSELEIKRVLPRDALVLDGGSVHQLIGGPLQGDAVHLQAGPGCHGRRVKREVAGNGIADILRQDHNIVFTWKANMDLIQLIEYRTEKQNVS